MTASPASRIAFVNADIGRGRPDTLHIRGARIAALGGAPRRGEIVVDLAGDRVLPGLINAHDHLQLNTLPPTEPGGRYRNVREWIADIEARRRDDAAFAARVAIPCARRLLIGGVKNLLSGATTVAHHDPLHPFCTSAEFPVHVVANYGWSHSLYVDGADGVLDAYRRTPADQPWIIHAAEGVDDEAAGELERLEALGCVGANTVIVHGVALDEAQRARLRRAGAGLVWCPSSNIRLFGKTADVAELAERGRVALGTDSRLTGARDLLEELRIAREAHGIGERTLEALATSAGARLLRLADRGILQAGAAADLVILPAGMRISEAARTDVRLVLRDGIARYGDVGRAWPIPPPSGWTSIRVDGRPKVLESRLAALLSDGPEAEAGVEIAAPPADRGETRSSWPSSASA